MRWNDPVKGMIPPCEFISVLEEVNLIYKLDLYVTKQVLEKMKKQAEAGLYVVSESVNLSRADFNACDIVEEIRKLVDASGMSRDKLNIEVTESVIGKDFEFMKAQIERFRSLGFHVWMDDFGSGYSTLDVLQSIRFDLIKFDMRFMKEFDTSEKSRIMLTELIRMAISLGVDTVCEGVETKEQADFLREIGCTMMQGYYFCRPITTSAARFRLKRFSSGTKRAFRSALKIPRSRATTPRWARSTSTISPSFQTTIRCRLSTTSIPCRWRSSKHKTSAARCFAATTPSAFLWKK